jgi:tetratricopeptide (TPR) repeat protein
VRLDPDSWIELGEYRVSHDRDDEAAVAFRHAVADALDRVRLSNEVEFLVDYMVDHGEKEEALAVAREAAETYSGAGLGTMARLQERLGAYDAAERYFKQEAERYPGNNTELEGYYVRYELRVGDGRYTEAARAARASLFPAGLERNLPPPAARPRGVRVVRCSERFQRMGLRKGDVIVSIDGYRVQNLPQYRCLRRAADGATAAVTVWRDGKYADAAAPRRGLAGLYFETFPKP